MTARADVANGSPPQLTQELLRILAIPRRTYTPDEHAEMVRGMTDMLRLPSSPAPDLWAVQAQALLEISACDGGFLPVRVGGGKTLISLLAPTVLSASRPLLVVPAKLVEKTNRAYRALSYAWRIHPSIRIVSYEILGRVSGAQIFEQWRPDVIVCDEGHKIKATTAAVTKRFLRWVKQASPRPRVVLMSGTVTKRSIWDYAHLLQAALPGPRCPIPLTYSDLEAWSTVLDERPRTAPCDVGALQHLCPDRRPASVDDVRRGFRRRLVDTLGVIATEETALDLPIIIERFPIELPATLRKALADMRATWATPDGEPFLDAISLWRHCRELALGFFYRWNPKPPEPWRMARSAWAKWCRYILSSGRRGADSELEVIRHVDKGHYPDAAPTLEAWRQVRDTFKPVTEAVWLDRYLLDALRHVDDPSLVWVEHRAFGEALALHTGMPYYGQEARTRAGRSIMDHDPRMHGSAICSIKSVGEGFDLQRFSKNVIASVLTHGPGWEQLLARTHRPGQTADEVTAQVVVTCDEHKDALRQARADARYCEASTGQKQKLLMADWTFEVDE